MKRGDGDLWWWLLLLLLFARKSPPAAAVPQVAALPAKLPSSPVVPTITPPAQTAPAPSPIATIPTVAPTPQPKPPIETSAFTDAVIRDILGGDAELRQEYYGQSYQVAPDYELLASPGLCWVELDADGKSTGYLECPIEAFALRAGGS